jgi:pimeloyl-ACP methyl ester carboxylesterase
MSGASPAWPAATMPDHAWQEWGGSGPRLHFAHANGFPPGAYRQLLEPLTRCFTVVASEARPLWSAEPPSSLRSWQPLADDLTRAITSHELQGALGVGHSLGGVATLLAASRRPELLSAIILIDPLVLTGVRSLAWRLIQRTGLIRRIELIRRAERRRMVWPDRRTVRQAWAPKPLFEGWAPGALDDYLGSVLVDHPEGVALRYSGAWEARIFERSPHSLWPAIRRLAVPTLFIRGARSTTLSAAAARRLQRVGPLVEVLEVPRAGHLVPMERPAELATLIIEHGQRLLDRG